MADHPSDTPVFDLLTRIEAELEAEARYAGHSCLAQALRHPPRAG